MKIPMVESDEAKFEMAPMIDMVFLLLVFFMMASRMSVLQNVDLDIPTATKAVVPKERPSRFVVNIREDGVLFGGSREVSLDELKDMVEQRKEADPTVKIYLRADQLTEHKHVRKVMGAMAELGIDDFIFGAFIPN